MANDLFPVERNRYFYGKLLTVKDFETEQNYNRNKHRFMNISMNGSGVVYGLGVTVQDDSTLLIESGLAIDYEGQEIVIEEPLIRKLPMIDGFETIEESTDAWLGINYEEKETNPVNAVNTGTSGNSEFNMTRESYRLFITAEKPDYKEILEGSGYKNVNTIYDSEKLTIVMAMDDVVVSGSNLNVHVLIIKDYNTPPVNFVLSGQSEFTNNGLIELAYSQGSTEKRQCVIVDLPVEIDGVSDYEGQLFSRNVELNLEIGSRHYKNYIKIDAEVSAASTAQEADEIRRKRDNLADHIREKNVPIYLAKIELIHSTVSMFINMITDLPFDQRIRKYGASVTKSDGIMEVQTTVRQLDYWQKPDVRSNYNPKSGKLSLDFGLPGTEQYDYSVSHGVVDLEMPGGIKVNSRFYSEEIPHGLGAGTVDVRLSIEFMANDSDKALLFGNKEVFKSKHSGINPPWAEVAAVVFPEKGTMKIGVWLHDTVEGNRIRVHYFAQKPERDTDRIYDKSKPVVRLIPEVIRLSAEDKIHFRALVEGSNDKNVSFRIEEEGGGTIDVNGVYQAPEQAGTYEIIATSTADPDVSASAYVIVE
ncbi:MAG: hypothetical protein K5894_09500 [Lachnospiraceae bacterium]|nr:hypothetical protein [Lachnospiraceae bacterium]